MKKHSLLLHVEYFYTFTFCIKIVEQYGTTCPVDDVSLDSQQMFRGVWGFLTLEH
jgi:hypothetical protein